MFAGVRVQLHNRLKQEVHVETQQELHCTRYLGDMAFSCLWEEEQLGAADTRQTDAHSTLLLTLHQEQISCCGITYWNATFCGVMQLHKIVKCSLTVW